MNLQFESLSPQEAAISNAKIIITTKAESLIVNRDDVLLDTELDEHHAIIKSKILKNMIGCNKEFLYIGIDPGQRIGVSIIYCNREIDSFVESSPYAVISKVSNLFSKINAVTKILRIGDGDRDMAAKIALKILRRSNDIIVEIVDERKTSNSTDIGINRRGFRDRSAAKLIALRKGQPFSNAGED